METRTIVGQGKYIYEVDKRWGRGPRGVAAFGIVSGSATDSRDRVYVFNRAPDPRVIVMDRDGTLLSEWGRGQFKHPHGIWISPQDELYCTDRDTHLVTRWTTDGKLLQSWGTPDQPGAPGQPFNQPTHAMVTPHGELYVSDGYGQHRVHRFGADGKLKTSWGEKGTGPGQFALPHDVWVDPRDRVLVCDRENQRVQHFDRDGKYVGEWSDLKAPMQIFVKDAVLYLAEAGQQITIMTLDAKVLAQWGSKGPADDQFTDSPHSIWVDSRGDIYVSEVLTPDKFQKFVLKAQAPG
jgi:DNA-binding beta-propeller fold protein YncE